MSLGAKTPSPGRYSSDERFRVVYRIVGDEAEARARAQDVAVEQTVEFPFDLLPEGDIKSEIVGRVERLEPAESDGGSPAWRATISYAVETTGFELTQLLNVVFGNYSMKPGVRVERLDLPEVLLRALPGPRFGREGLRARLSVPRRALLCTALKPMGLSAAALGDLAYQLALGGIDIIKDDHGLANQRFAPFDERVGRCVEAVARANQETSRRAVYAPNVTAVGEETFRRARRAKAAGAEALLVVPGLAGLGSLAQLAAGDSLDLPLLSHPAFQGSFAVSPDSGISHAALYGQIARLAGADGTIYPNYGGRFSFSQDECRGIAAATVEPMGPIRPIFPVPGGGMRIERVPELLDFYGNEVILLVGGGLFQASPDLVANARAFRRLVAADEG